VAENPEKVAGGDGTQALVAAGLRRFILAGWRAARTRMRRIGSAIKITDTAGLKTPAISGRQAPTMVAPA
jgi:hypothetical protein